ncbi:hypothetical protein [Parvularcula marina]|uniref:Uncharacterized protein n=1 Tax=Parvularcula marina TaxID=2292771 RepID=A0A371R7L4_9PROT|nr:hypothetical protein [Parvularcula marina]RFB01419.1 hypothetical protein DX908_14095 [Parvularcula marina]
MSGINYEVGCQKLWAALCDANQTAPTSETYDALKKLLREGRHVCSVPHQPHPLDRFLDIHGLGIVLRINAALNVVRPEDCGDICSRIRAYAAKLPEPGTSRFEGFVCERTTNSKKPVSAINTGDEEVALHRFFNPKSQSALTLPASVFEEIANVLCDWRNNLPEYAHTEYINPRDFLTLSFAGKDAIKNFEKWFATGVYVEQPAQPNSSDDFVTPGFFDPGNWPFFKLNRETLIEEIKQWLCEHSDQRVFNVFAPTTMKGQGALAKHIGQMVPKISGLDLRVICLPMSAADMTAAPYSYHQIVKILHEFAHERSWPSSEALAVPIGDARLARMIKEIRNSLVNKPALIIFWGHTECDSTFHEVFRIIRDDHVLTTLVPALLEPPTMMPNGEPVNLDTWRLNRILVVSNKPLKETDESEPEKSANGLQRYRKVSHLISRASILPKAHKNDMKKIDESHQYTNLKTLIMWKERAIKSETSENLLRILDAAISLSDRLSLDREQLRTRVESIYLASIHEKNRARKVSRLIMEMLKDNKPVWWFWMVTLIATPDGVQPNTLNRLTRDFRAKARPKAQRSANLKEVAQDDFGLSSIGVMQSVLAPIATFGRYADYLGRGIPDDLIAEQGSPERVLEFRHGSIRQIFLDSFLSDRENFSVLRTIHVLLCQEALSQYSVHILHAEPAERHGLRSQRRLFQAILHGLSAIGLVRAKSMDKSLVRTGETLQIPHMPYDLWEYLFNDIYLRLLENIPNWRLSRVFGRDQAKIELLTAFLRPWLLLEGADIDEPNREQSVLDDPKFPEHSKKSTYEIIMLSEGQALRALNLNFSSATCHDIDAASSRHVSLGVLERQHKQELDKAILEFPNIGDKVYHRLEQFKSRSFPDVNIDESMVAAGTQLCNDLLQYASKKVSIIEQLARSGGGGELLGVAIASNVSDIKCILNEYISSGRISDVSHAINVLNRYAEIIATSAELQRLLDKEEWLRTYNAHRLIVQEFGCPTGVEVNFKGGMHLFAHAFAVYEVAEIVRMIGRRAFPGKPGFSVSGHPTRNAIRVAAKLENYALQHEQTSSYSGNQEYRVFGQYARLMLDELIRTHVIYDRERAVIYVIEAMMTRLMQRPHDSILYLKRALSLLARAETLVFSFSPVTRLRARFLLERSKLSYRMYDELRVKPNQSEAAQMWRKNGKRDADMLRVLAERFHGALWVQLAEYQQTKYEVSPDS